MLFGYLSLVIKPTPGIQVGAVKLSGSGVAPHSPQLQTALTGSTLTDDQLPQHLLQGAGPTNGWSSDGNLNFRAWELWFVGQDNYETRSVAERRNHCHFKITDLAAL